MSDEPKTVMYQGEKVFLTGGCPTTCPSCGKAVEKVLRYMGMPVLVCPCVPNDFILSVDKDGKQMLNAIPEKSTA